MYRICKRFGFEAAHHLPGLPSSHKCSRPHGHSYTVQVSLTAEELTETGFVVDFAELSVLGRYLQGTFDHRDLNEVLDVPPTSENLARLIFGWCTENLDLPSGVSVESVRVSETTSTYAEYTPGLP